MKRTLLIGAAVLVVVVVSLVGLVFLSLPTGSVTTSDDGVQTVELAMITVPIASDVPLVETGPTQYLGVPHSEPEFDTALLGAEISFVQDTSDLPSLDPDEVLRAVYLGHDVHGEPYYIFQSGSPDFRRTLGQIVADLGAIGRLGTSYGSLVVGDPPWESSVKDSIAQHGLTTGSAASSGGPFTLTLEWHALPEEVAAVVLYDNGRAVGWQRPVSGTAAFQFVIEGQAPGTAGSDAEMVALTTSGEEWNRYSWTEGFAK